MIIDTLANADRYAALHPLFAAAFAYLRRADLASLPVGRHTIDGDALFLLVQKSPGRPREEAKLESHRKYIDIQFVIAGSDEMGWRPTAECRLVRSAYSAEKDIGFFDDPAATWVTAPAGSYCIFFPEDAHAPLVSEGEIHKVVVKVAI